MVEATEKIVTNVLQEIASYGFLQRIYFYGSAATQEIWTALTTPENIPVFISSLIKSSLGPTLAFLWGRWAFRQEETVRREKETAKSSREAEAVKTMLKMEIAYNVKRIEQLVKEYELLLIVPSDKRGKGVSFISPHGLQTQALDSLIDQLPHALTPDEITSVYKFYGDFRAIIYAYDIRQPKIIHTIDSTERRLCEETLRHLNCFLDTKSLNPLARAWFPEWLHIEP